MPAAYGATAPPEKRTKEYAAEATGRSTGAAPMTASVMTVLLMPRNAPATITPTTRTVLSSVQIAIAARSSAKSVSEPRTVGTDPIRRCRIGATHTEVIASSTPQPKKIRPTWWAFMSSGNGVNASSVKKPML